MSLRLAEIWIYPVKSLAGVRVSRATVDDRGLAGDRRFMVVDEGDRFVTQRELPSMAALAAELDEAELTLRDRGGARLAVPLDCDAGTRQVVVWEDRVSARDAGDPAAAWLSERLERRVRLVRLPEDTRRAVDPEHARQGDVVSFADGFPFLLITEAAIEELNQRLDRPVDSRRFRPNLVVSGAPAFAEDEWTSLRIGPVTFHARKACSRCSIVNVDPDLATQTTEPLGRLAAYRKRGSHVMFGQNLVHDGRGEIREGDPVLTP